METTQTDTESTSPHTDKGDNSEPNKAGSFTSAFKEKYCYENFEPQVAIIQFHSKVATQHLKTVDLSMKEIRHAGIPETGLSLICPNIVDLDISHNQFEKWSEILSLLYELPHLEYLNLTNNPLHLNQDYLDQLEKPLKKLENLALNRTKITLEDVLKLSRIMPALKELHLCDNGYRELLGLDDGDLPQVECLRMNDNQIVSWTEVWKLRHLPNLKSLILSGNPLQDVFYTDPCCQGNQEDSNSICNKEWKSSNSANISENCDKISEDGNLSNICDKIHEHSNSVRTEKNDISYESCDTQGSKVSDDVTQVCSNMVNEMLASAFSASLSTNQMTENNTGVTNDNTVEDCQLDENEEIENESGFKKFLEKDLESRTPFESLETLCLTDTCLHHWQHLQALNQFPALRSVRIKTTTLYSDVSEEDRRKLLIASLSKVDMFNGSEISLEEREDAERFYIRHYVDETEKPERVKELEQVHGQLSKIVDIHIGWNTPLFPRVHFYVNEKKVFTEKVDVKQTVQKLRKYLSKKLDIMYRVMIIYHLPCGPSRKHRMGEEIAEKEEMCYFNLPLSRFGIHDDDEIHVQVSGRYP